jgi:hypothetical protein
LSSISSMGSGRPWSGTGPGAPCSRVLSTTGTRPSASAATPPRPRRPWPWTRQNKLHVKPSSLQDIGKQLCARAQRTPGRIH